MRLRAVTALPNQSLHLVFQDGFEADVALGDWIANTCALQALADPALFPRARVGEWGSAVEWITDELDLRADNLRHLAVEQQAYPGDGMAGLQGLAGRATGGPAQAAPPSDGLSYCGSFLYIKRCASVVIYIEFH